MSTPDERRAIMRNMAKETRTLISECRRAELAAKLERTRHVVTTTLDQGEDAFVAACVDAVLRGEELPALPPDIAARVIEVVMQDRPVDLLDGSVGHNFRSLGDAPLDEILEGLMDHTQHQDWPAVAAQIEEITGAKPGRSDLHVVRIIDLLWSGHAADSRCWLIMMSNGRRLAIIPDRTTPEPVLDVLRHRLAMYRNVVDATEDAIAFLEAGQ